MSWDFKIIIDRDLAMLRTVRVSVLEKQEATNFSLKNSVSFPTDTAIA